MAPSVLPRIWPIRLQGCPTKTRFAPMSNGLRWFGHLTDGEMCNDVSAVRRANQWTFL